MSYFNNFPTVNYDVSGQGDYTLLTDFTPNFKVRTQNVLNNISYLNYVIDDGARPDVVSHYLYGTPEYYWTFNVINDNIRLSKNDWPLSDRELDVSIASKYDNYSVMSFNPISVPGAREDNMTYGNMSCVPFKDKYRGLLRIIPVLPNGSEVDAYSILEKYDYSACALWIQRAIKSTNTNPISTLSFIDNYDRYKIKPVGDSDLVDQYRAEVAAAYGLTDSFEDTDDYLYEVAKDNNTKLNWEYSRNAAYQYFTVDTVTSETLSLNGYDVLAGSTPYSLAKYVSYAEKEIIENNRKKTISVVHPNNIVEFVKSYFDTLRNA